MCQTASHYLLLALMALPIVLGAIHEHLETIPKGWSAMNVSPSSVNTTFTIALKMQNIDQLESKLLAVSTPGNTAYGQYWDVDEVNTVFAPSSSTVFSIVEWLKFYGITRYSANGAFVDFTANIDTVNTLLNASYQYYTSNGVTKLRTQSYSIPESIKEHVVLVDPGTYFGSLAPNVPIHASTKTTERSRTTTKTSVDLACQASISPACLNEMYNVGSYIPRSESGSSIGFGSFLNQSAIYNDLFQFEEYFGIPNQNISVELIAGATNNQNISTAQYTEASLDIQTIIGIAHPLPVVEFITGGSPPFNPNIDHQTAERNFNEPYVPYYRYLLSKSNEELPQVISNSYGEQEDSVPYNYAVLTCNLIGMMGLRGITILQSSGDTGVGSGCLATDFKTVEFYPIFPASCPWVTSVGGTVNVTPEAAWKGSSGGFSKYFPRPAYQDLAIIAYNETLSQETYKYYGKYTNWAGRGFPDVAAHSLSPDFEVVYAGELSASGGTSASAPVWAAIVSILNDARFRVGKPALGWLNPLIYTFGQQVLTDITDGFTTGCDGTNPGTGATEPEGAGIVPGARWNATVGWDTTTGYGTPDFQKLKDLVLSI